MRLQSLLVGSAASVLMGISAVGAQTYIVDPGTTYVTSGLTSAMLGSQLTGMLVTARFGDGSTSFGTWGFLFDAMDGPRYGVITPVFRVLMRGDADTGGPGPSINDLNFSNVNATGQDFVGFVLEGLGANAVFDRTFGGVEGTAGSGLGRDLRGANDPDFDEFDLTVIYRNAVSLGGAAPVGDLFETVDVTFGTVLGEGETASIWLDTDLAENLTVVVPEPASFALVGAGMALFGISTRLRRRQPG